MRIFELRLRELVPYANNPRNNANAVEAVANSIKQFGFKVPIVVDAKKEIIAGHTRVLAAALLGMETVPCVIADDLTPAQAQAFRLADNKTHEMAGWDFPMLEDELSEIGFDMTEFGFEPSVDMNWEDLLNSAEPTKENVGKKYHCLECGATFEA